MKTKHLNLKVALITNPVGKDEEGHKIINYFRKHKVTTKIRKVPWLKTPFIVILSDSKGNREWFPYISEVNPFLKKVDLTLVAKSSLVYVDYYQIIREASQRMINFASQHGIPSFINLGGSPFTPKLSNSLRGKKVIAVQTNLEENQIRNAEPLVRSIYNHVKPQVAIVTLGSKCLRFGCTLGTINCTLERSFEVFSQKEVEEFLRKWPR
ncbi:MAG: hypothetical protein ACPLXP_01230 [Microgenomates group bacterium]